jgi:hypothetical protein
MVLLDCLGKFGEADLIDLYLLRFEMVEEKNHEQRNENPQNQIFVELVHEGLS